MRLDLVDEIIAVENEQAFDTETMNQIILCMGVMFGVANAKNALLAMAKASLSTELAATSLKT